AQSSNVGNESAIPNNTTSWNAPCVYPPVTPTLQCLYDFTGYVNWPTPTSFFDWDAGDPAVALDSVMVFDASLAEGDAFQQIRGWVANPDPVQTGSLIS